MLSILIPTYHYNALPLVTSLHEQALKTGVTFEIICFDDGSNSKENTTNEKINDLPHAYFKSLSENVGLSQNRNLLAQQSKYEYLLFIDGDSLIVDPDFLSKYLQSLPWEGIVYGGRQHPLICPSSSQKLRWKYGIIKEDKIALERKKHPYQCLLFNNALIYRDVFKLIKFEKDITQYGHEDTLFAFHAQQFKIPVSHIENPVHHKDIDTSAVYLEKTNAGLQNLFDLYYHKKVPAKFVTLLRYYTLLKKLHLIGCARLSNRLLKKMIYKNLTSSNPWLFLFYLHKLGHFCTLKSSK